jgi:endonuclease/exonuclease/phosphatase family metal-dependent hydrolase
MTRVLSYNILLGGTQRVEQLAAIIRSAQPDIVGLVEATNPLIVEELAHRLDMQFSLTGQARSAHDWNVAVLSRLPIIQTRTHTRPGIFTRRHLLEVTVEETTGVPLAVFVTHLTANFYQGMRSVHRRRREVEEILSIMAPYQDQGRPHLVMGDFNSLTPGEQFKGSALLRYFRSEQRSRAPVALFDSRKKSILRRCIRRVQLFAIYCPLLSPFADQLSEFYARGGIDLLHRAGYIDCFRSLHPDHDGFTFHSSMPVGRIDYIFASPEMAPRLTSCEIITEGNGVKGTEASDHLPLFAEFATPVAQRISSEETRASTSGASTEVAP